MAAFKTGDLVKATRKCDPEQVIVSRVRDMDDLTVDLNPSLCISTDNWDFEVLESALQVGWHRVLPADDMEVVTAMYWSGTDWKYNESTTRSSFNRWTSVGYLGTGVKA